MTTPLTSQEVKKQVIQNVMKDRHGKDLTGRIITVIRGYGKRDGVLNNIAALFYRIWNAVKAVFGRSDWQLVKKAHLIELEEKVQVYQNTPSIKRLPKELAQKQINLERHMEEKIMEAYLAVNVDATYETTFSSTEQVDDYLKTFLEKKLDKLKSLLRQRSKDLENEISEYMNSVD